MYPSEKQLKTIKNWQKDYNELLKYVKTLWVYSFYVWEPTTESPYWRFATGGWSGNESLIAALEENRLFWAMCWKASYRGGVYEFDVKLMEE